jgi:hypothetical protein
MNCYILYASKKDTCIYAHEYAHDTDECLSDITRAYDIDTKLYLRVCACITISYELYHVHMCMYIRYIQICILLGSSYLYVSALYHVHIRMYI